MLNIKTFEQEKKYIMDFIIEFKALAIKAKINNIHTIFLLKKNIRSNIIKTILGLLWYTSTLIFYFTLFFYLFSLI